MKMIRRTLCTLGILVAIFMLVPTDSMARDRRHRYPHERIFRHGQRMHDRVFRRVPHRMYFSSRASYRPYYSGRVYFRPHHHYHLAYRFPIYVGGSVVYRPSYYCGEHLYLSGGASYQSGDYYDDYDDDYYDDCNDCDD
ncbi:MAG TPA: hypothetical protein VGR38_10520 [Candidatus Polarisedimenticolia bacterium]|nr:hypothetical protein [Candidatus Polarisedimenticolia bacterium]